MATNNTQSETSQNNSGIVPGIISNLFTEGPSRLTGTRVDLTQEEMFTLLKNSRRRAVIRLVGSTAGELTLREVSERIAATEENIDPEDVPSDLRKRFYVSYYQTHLPELDKHEVITFEKGENIIRPGKNLPGLIAMLEKSDEMIR